MNRINILNDIKTSLARFTQEVRNHTASNTYDINIHAETVLIPLLNKVFHINLKNLNSEQKNYPAIDLCDFQARIAFQVTSDASSTKITETITKFIEREQYNVFDRLIVYIISERQNSYKKDFSTHTKNLIEFDESRDIIDNASLSKKINEILDISQIEEIRDILASEFSDKKVNEREYLLKNKQPVKTDNLVLNFVKFKLPERLYFAIHDIDDSKLPDRVKQLRKEKILPFKKGKLYKVHGKDLVNAKLLDKGKELNKDFVLFQDKLYTFRDLHSVKEPFREVIDLGTIDYISPLEFFDKNENYLSKFKELIRNSMIENFKEKGIEWVEEDKLFRFSATGVNSSLPMERKVSWTKETKSQPRTVVFEMINKQLKKENQTRIICFKHLAFFLEIEKYEDWYVSIKPTWSFTNPNNGKAKSRFASSYLAGIKKMELNEAVLNHFLFITNCIKERISEMILDNQQNQNSYEIIFSDYVSFKKFTPAINDADWKPRTLKGKDINTNQIQLEF